jgi:molybdopterin-guanine dinucleotide biosynthesis protein A
VDAFAGFGARVVADVYPGKGSLGGIFSGLRAAREAYVVAVACDMPFLNQDLIRYQLSLAAEYDVVIPRAQDPSGRVRRPKHGGNPLAKDVNLHPMHAIYSRNCESAIQERLDMDDLRMISFLERVRVHVVEPEEVDRFDSRHWSFFNVNTPQDLEAARRLQSTEEGSRADAQA